MKLRLSLGSVAFAAFALLAAPVCHAAKANKSSAEAIKAEEANEAPAQGAAAEPEQPVEVIIVWGFRVRATKFDERNPSLIDGYGELINKPECATTVCGFVVFHDGTKWRYTNVLAGEEDRLRALQSALDYDRQTLVIVHPNGEKRTIPKF